MKTKRGRNRIDIKTRGKNTYPNFVNFLCGSGFSREIEPIYIKSLLGIDSQDYGGRKVPGSTVSKLETQRRSQAEKVKY